MKDTRMRNVNWTVNSGASGGFCWDAAILAVLMDIRERLDTLQCPNFTAIPHTLTRIEKNTRKPKRKRPVAKKVKR